MLSQPDFFASQLIFAFPIPVLLNQSLTPQSGVLFYIVTTGENLCPRCLDAAPDRFFSRFGIHCHRKFTSDA